MVLSHCFFNEQLGLEVVDTCDTIESVLGEGKEGEKGKNAERYILAHGALDPSCYPQELRVHRVPLHEGFDYIIFHI
jgi:hypothetical protein